MALYQVIMTDEQRIEALIIYICIYMSQSHFAFTQHHLFLSGVRIEKLGTEKANWNHPIQAHTHRQSRFV